MFRSHKFGSKTLSAFKKKKKSLWSTCASGTFFSQPNTLVFTDFFFFFGSHSRGFKRSSASRQTLWFIRLLHPAGSFFWGEGKNCFVATPGGYELVRFFCVVVLVVEGGVFPSRLGKSPKCFFFLFLFLFFPSFGKIICLLNP